MEYKKTNLLELTESRLNLNQEKIHFLIYLAIAFLIPLIFKHQLLVGAIVNTILILSALNLKAIRILPAIFLPSIAAALGGIIFGGFTVYLIYMIPFIWVGNFSLVLLFKKLKLEQKRNYAVTLPVAAIVKSGLIFSGAALLFWLKIIPSALLLAMGPIQLVTALLGGVAAFVAQKMVQ